MAALLPSVRALASAGMEAVTFTTRKTLLSGIAVPPIPRTEQDFMLRTALILMENISRPASSVSTPA